MNNARSFIFLLISALLLAQNAIAQDHISIQKIDQQTLIVFNEMYGSNVGIISNGTGLTLIDPVLERGDQNLLTEIIARNFDIQVERIFNTHQHDDHTEGNEYFAEQGAIVVAPNNSDQQDEGHLEGVEITKVISHTVDDYLIYFPQKNILFVGDVIDTSWHPTFWAGGLEGLEDAATKIMNITNNETLILPGHGAPIEREDVRTYFQNTTDWVKVIGTLHADGSAIDEIKSHPDVLKTLKRLVGDKTIYDAALTRFIERTISVLEKSGY